MCSHTAVCVRPHTARYVSAYCVVCVLILLCMCPHAICVRILFYVSSYCYICVLILLCMCLHAICFRILLYVCPHTAMYASSYCCISVRILLYLPPHAAIYVDDVVTELLHMLRIQCYDRKKLDARLEKDKCSRLVCKSGSKTSKKVRIFRLLPNIYTFI
jgi:hypothetical protein